MDDEVDSVVCFAEHGLNAMSLGQEYSHMDDDWSMVTLSILGDMHLSIASINHSLLRLAGYMLRNRGFIVIDHPLESGHIILVRNRSRATPASEARAS